MRLKRKRKVADKSKKTAKSKQKGKGLVSIFLEPACNKNRPKQFFKASCKLKI